jgi:hypothetical protein
MITETVVDVESVAVFTRQFAAGLSIRVVDSSHPVGFYFFYDKREGPDGTKLSIQSKPTTRAALLEWIAASTHVKATLAVDDARYGHVVSVDFFVENPKGE